MSVIASLSSKIKRARGNCLDVGKAIEQVIAENPNVPVEEIRAAALCIGRVPFPSIDGNPPVYRDRPYFDARFFRGEP